MPTPASSSSCHHKAQYFVDSTEHEYVQMLCEKTVCLAFQGPGQAYPNMRCLLANPCHRPFPQTLPTSYIVVVVVLVVVVVVVVIVPLTE